jgi:hypothetical protein
MCKLASSKRAGQEGKPSSLRDTAGIRTVLLVFAFNKKHPVSVGQLQAHAFFNWMQAAAQMQVVVAPAVAVSLDHRAEAGSVSLQAAAAEAADCNHSNQATQNAQPAAK